jgi:excisionase family DNA binding protein
MNATDSPHGFGERLAFTLAEALEIVPISRSTLKRLIAEGAVKPIRLGRRVLIPRGELERLAREGATPVSPAAAAGVVALLRSRTP